MGSFTTPSLRKEMQPDLTLKLPRSAIPISLVFILVAVMVFLWYSLHLAHLQNGTFGFPLDDPWIHLQFARNIHEYGSYSYFKDEIVTSGSTSPLYTLLLALGFSITTDEFLLSYSLDILFLLAAGVMLFRLVTHTIPDGRLVALAATAALLMEPRLHWAALSGMETTLFIFMLLLVFDAYLRKKQVVLGISSGLLIWIRPEAVLFLFILGVHVLYEKYWVPSRTQRRNHESTGPSFKWLRRPILVLVVIGLGYAVFNLILSGSLFPNTFAAKIKYYSVGSGRDFHRDFLQFVAGGHMILPAFLAVIGLIHVFNAIRKRNSTTGLVAVLWIAGMYLAYWRNLPFLYQEGRYMMPIIPFVLILAVGGARWLGSIVRRFISQPRETTVVHIAAGTTIALVAALNSVAAVDARHNYIDMCLSINQKQVRTAHWIRDHLPVHAVVGTHDIGAIAYYSGRKIADMVGLISREMIRNIGNLVKLKDFLRQSGVTHLAVLHNWFEVTNQRPLFETRLIDLEVMQVFDFDSVYTHITPTDAGKKTNLALQYLTRGKVNLAGPLLQESFALDPLNAKTLYGLGLAYFMVGKIDDAEQTLKKSIALHPELWDSYLMLAQIAARRNNPDAAIDSLQTLIRRDPSYFPAYRALAEIYATVRNDTVSAREMMEAYARIKAATESRE
jgi:tetratricopeptide (TPR) repeat protein